VNSPQRLIERDWMGRCQSAARGRLPSCHQILGSDRPACQLHPTSDDTAGVFGFTSVFVRWSPAQLAQWRPVPALECGGRRQKPLSSSCSDASKPTTSTLQPTRVISDRQRFPADAKDSADAATTQTRPPTSKVPDLVLDRFVGHDRRRLTEYAPAFERRRRRRLRLHPMLCQDCVDRTSARSVTNDSVHDYSLNIQIVGFQHEHAVVRSERQRPGSRDWKRPCVLARTIEDIDWTVRFSNYFALYP
jgi:hypothetical protein